jgi:hypothetical protein
MNGYCCKVNHIMCMCLKVLNLHTDICGWKMFFYNDISTSPVLNLCFGEGATCRKFRIYLHGANSRLRLPHYRDLMITLRHSTTGTSPLDEWSPHCWDLYIIRHNTHNRQAFMALAGLEPTIPASERPRTHALDRAASGSWLTSNRLIKD